MVDGQGKIVWEAKMASEPEALIAWFAGARNTACADSWRQAAVALFAVAAIPPRLVHAQANRAACGLEPTFVAW